MQKEREILHIQTEMATILSATFLKASYYGELLHTTAMNAGAEAEHSHFKQSLQGRFLPLLLVQKTVKWQWFFLELSSISIYHPTYE